MNLINNLGDRLEMEEQRYKAYVNLIEQLLGCPHGQENMLLQINAELFDAGLETVMKQYAIYLESQDRRNAGRLQSLAAQLRQILDERTENLDIEENSSKFFSETLQLIASHRGNPQEIYPIWAQQQAFLNPELLREMPNITMHLLEINSEQLAFIASLIGAFGDLIQKFPLGLNWLNLELSIAAYKQAINIRSKNKMPVEWAETMNNLAMAYRDRILGNRSENLEQAITACHQVLTIRTESDMPIEWAQTTSNLASIYLFRVQGNREENLERCIVAYQKSLTIITPNAMLTGWAQIMSDLGNAYFSRIRGDRATNLEKAIDNYQQALTVRTKSAMPIQWAHTLTNLAAAYFERIKGNRAKNLEHAITACQQALEVLSQTTMTAEWAMTMNNLANAYINRIKGDKAENLEQAISAYQQVLTEITHSTMPRDWAETVMNLASAYLYRIRGDRAENLEQAISYYQQALTVRTEGATPIDWATSMYNLANAYVVRIRGDHAENIEQAITAYRQALTIRTQETMPIKWAQTMAGMASAFYIRIRGDRRENIEESITAYQQALTVITQHEMPRDWATIVSNLAMAYRDRIQGAPTDNIEQSIAANKKALTVMSQETMPLDWARIMMNLANTYLQRIQGVRAENIEQSIACCNNSLTVRDRKAMPIEWAQTTVHLANAYSNRIKGDRAENIGLAIKAYEQALTVMTTALPDYCRTTSTILANLYSDEARWTDATRTYRIALQAAEICYQRSDYLDSKSSELSITADLPRRAAYAYTKMGDLQKAVETLEQGRARGLSESLNRNRADLTQLEQTYPNLYREYKNLTAQLRTLEIQQRNSDITLTRPEIQIRSQTPYQQLHDTLEQIRQIPGYEEFLKATTFADIKQAVTSDRPLTYLVTTPKGGMAITVTVDEIELLWLDDLTETRLIDIIDQTWFAAYDQFQSDRQSWFDAIDDVTRQLWDALMGPLVQKLQEMDCDRITLIPTGYLSLFPLHATWTEDESNPKGRRYTLDDLQIFYTPNAKSLTAAQAIIDSVQADSILAVDNPRQDLPNSEQEVQASTSTFSKPTVLRHDQATVEQVKAQLPNVTIAHFSCHGTANLTNPLTSGLLMSDGLLILNDIFALNLADPEKGNQGLRLAILSACETGMTGTQNADEAISLPTGLLQAGVAAIIASLWAVQDDSTMLLLSKFYDLWRKDNLEPSQALREAQIWLRDSTEREIAPLLGQRTRNPDNRPFAHPYYWSAFSYTGI